MPITPEAASPDPSTEQSRASLTPDDVLQILRDGNRRFIDGKLHERIYDVAVSDGRVIPVDGGKVAPVGSTVDLEGPSYTNTLGDPELGYPAPQSRVRPR